MGYCFTLFLLFAFSSLIEKEFCVYFGEWEAREGDWGQERSLNIILLHFSYIVSLSYFPLSTATDASLLSACDPWRCIVSIPVMFKVSLLLQSFSGIHRLVRSINISTKVKVGLVCTPSRVAWPFENHCRCRVLMCLAWRVFEWVGEWERCCVACPESCVVAVSLCVLRDVCWVSETGVELRVIVLSCILFC